MTAGSWVYIGTQGILQGTYETLASLARIEFGSGDLAGRWTLTSGLGEMGGAQPLAITMLGGVGLIVDVDPQAIERRLKFQYLDEEAHDLDDALARVARAVRERRPLSVGLRGNAADVYPEIARRGTVPDIVSDQTAAHDLRVGYIPQGMTVEEATVARTADLPGYLARVKSSIALEARAILEMRQHGAKAFDYGNNFRTQARDARRHERLRHRRICSPVHPAAVRRGKRPLPLARAQRRAGGHPPDRPDDPVGICEQRTPLPMDPPRRGARPIPGSSGAHLLHGLRRAGTIRTPGECDGARRRIARSGRHRSGPS